ncbi:male sterility protein-domain-containing protein [Aspergillus transmontanensis]|uniref:Male sterility protein-domain-containing protein n=1 Tax=Aspergillus transmontanensis TaxID=1034304 RepID=A0A5N6WDL9_9EURO|nr:male sterility protein-domain-containing protein [Aspergillus transmontanensis]
MSTAVGNRLLPHIMGSNAEADPMNHVVWWFEQTVTEHCDTTTVAYMGPNDIRYVISAIAIAKTFLPSTRNSAEANAHLLRAVDCNCLLWGGQSQPAHGQALVPDLQVWQFPSLDELLNSRVSHYPYNKTYQEAEDETFVILHSSGTTGAHHPVHRRPIHVDYGTDPQLIYRYCTIKSLSSYLRDAMKGNVSNGEAEDRGEDVQATLKHITNKYTNSLPKVEHQTIYVPAPSNIILTGSTGSLGSYLLDVLLLEPSIKKVYYLNRSSDAFERQIFSFYERQVNVKVLLSPKAEFLTTNLGGKTLGLSQSKYNELLNKTDAIVHNAWRVGFNLSVHSFKKDHIRGTRNLLNLSISSRKAAHMYFISSIATTSSWDPSRGKIPEDILPDTVEPPLQGYGQSKCVAENISLAVSTRSGVPVTILRVGQVAGPTTKSGGYWNPDEWFPSLVSTSKSMCSIPKWLGMPVEWIPVNTLAQVVLEIIQCGKDSKKSIPASVINLVNPTRTTWATLLPTIQRRIGANPVSLQSWVRALGETDAVNVGNRPAYKLLSFYERLARSNSDDRSPQFETNKASAASPTFRALGSIDSSLVHTWLDK